MPARIDREDLRLPASYANFYIANECVLLPTFNDPNDAIAEATLAKLFPRRRILPIDCTELIWGPWRVPLSDAAAAGRRRRHASAIAANEHLPPFKVRFGGFYGAARV